MEDTLYDVAVVGGGIIRLATALALTDRFPDLRLIILEKEAELAAHQTGHNSGVVHSGIYYRPGSHKARLCIEGRRRMTRFCEEHGIRIERCGKMIVATDTQDLPRVEELWGRGQAKGIEGLEKVGPEQMREIEPYAAGLQGIYSPATGIRDTPPGLRLRTALGEVRARRLVNCAGLYAVVVARRAGAAPDVCIVPFRGEYYLLRPDRRHVVRGLIYPVPNPQFPFLGLHFTCTVRGEVEAGPIAASGQWRFATGVPA